MKKVSMNLFAAVLRKGICQVLEKVLGVFGYKQKGNLAWKLLATSVSFIATVFAVMQVWSVGETVYEKYYKVTHCYDTNCFYSCFVGKHVYYHDRDDGKGYVFNSLTGQKTIKNVKWIARPEGDDSLVCYSDGKKRGYFSESTGKVVIEPKYDHAWIFSDGLACVDEGGRIKFINAAGQVVIDNKMPYVADMDGYLFYGGYCIVKSDDGKQLGLMDKTGKMVLPQEYSTIERDPFTELWSVKKGEEMAVLDQDMKMVVPFMRGTIYIGNSTIDMTMTDDHTMRKYDLNGQLINDFYVANVRTLEYEKDEILYRTRTHDDDGSEYAVPFVESYHPKATARLRAYMAGDSYEGLMTVDGHVVMMPMYKEIEAIGHDLYLCNSTDGDKVLVNGKGELVR